MNDLSLYPAVHAQNSLGKRSLSTAALPYQPQTLPGIDGKVRPFYRPVLLGSGKQAVSAVLIIDGQVADLKNRRGLQSPAAPIGAGNPLHSGRNRLHQHSGVLFPGTLKDLLRGSQLHHLTVLHHRNPMADPSGQIQIVGDEEHGIVLFLIDLPQKPHDLILNGHVQSGCGLVRNDEPGMKYDCHGDHDPLAHAAGQLVGIAGVHPLRIFKPHRLKGLQNLSLPLFLCQRPVQPQRLLHLPAHPFGRI